MRSILIGCRSRCLAAVAHNTHLSCQQHMVEGRPRPDGLVPNGTKVFDNLLGQQPLRYR
jgi:hypothetical protein